MNECWEGRRKGLFKKASPDDAQDVDKCSQSAKPQNCFPNVSHDRSLGTDVKRDSQQETFQYCRQENKRERKKLLKVSGGIFVDSFSIRTCPMRENPQPAELRSDNSVAVSTSLGRCSLSLRYDQPDPFGEPEFTDRK